ncbi:MAG: DNA-binding protein [Lachnospiraceae bacterium]|nr:DNA-binding protein [Lachnospiraceae bacterium]
MAETKKTAIVKPTAKATDTKTEEVKTTAAAPVAKAEPVIEPKKAEVKAETKKTVKKTTAKKTPAKKEAAAKKTTAKKETVKKEAPAKKAAVKETVHLQFAGRSYTTEDLVKIAKDVWKYDLNQKVGDFKSVELYVKPEENVVYYVINGDVTGSFGI